MSLKIQRDTLVVVVVVVVRNPIKTSNALDFVKIRETAFSIHVLCIISVKICATTIVNYTIR